LRREDWAQLRHRNISNRGAAELLFIKQMPFEFQIFILNGETNKGFSSLLRDMKVESVISPVK